jgi:hypothetical protein
MLLTRKALLKLIKEEMSAFEEQNELEEGAFSVGTPAGTLEDALKAAKSAIVQLQMHIPKGPEAKAQLQPIFAMNSALDNFKGLMSQEALEEQAEEADDFKEMGAMLQKADPILDQLATKAAKTMKTQLEPLLEPHLADLSQKTGLTPETVKPMLLKKALALVSGEGE